MNQKQKSNILSSKKERFRKEIRAQKLQNYMKKIRTQISDAEQFKKLTSIIYQVFSEDKNSKSTELSPQRMKNISNLIRIANNGSTHAIVALSELLLEKSITIQIIQSIHIQGIENIQNSNSGFKQAKPDLMKIMKFPQKQNQGWLAFIRVLLAEDYCTQQMILYCLRTIISSRSRKALDFALQIIYILVVSKKQIKIQELIRLLTANTNTQQSKHSPQRFFYSLMKLSLNSTQFQESKDIRYFSTKVLLKCFASSQIMSEVLLVVIPLAYIGEYLNEKFNNKGVGMWYQTKTLEMASNLLISLTQFNRYSIQVVINALFKPLKQIIDFLLKISFQAYLKKTSQNGLNHSHSINKIGDCEQNLRFLQQGVFLIDVIVDQYLTTQNNIQVTNQLLTYFRVQYILIYLFEAYGKKIERRSRQSQIFEQVQTSESLGFEDMCKSLLMQKIKELCQKMTKQLLDLQLEINSKNIKCTQQERYTFCSNTKIIFSRWEQSELKNIFKPFFNNTRTNQTQI